ncbi:putative transmembrane protein [Heterostelium album PN500]|uniref:Putative transmembrane protein n=1 Tax=Heterostelium pallidum (strain ATCC 26659 / Pp 5 / PN500) TaxID=670386 RepID=D3BLZ1_HETP5|nr:putative transmembrane protein [Heterostelium album PN500]EFA77592.1 putative transmembrane protein [Heterostelium album PN500]|eukprot:XP_020429720.1 putative transmembrane protein [Heterostelium album PN500]
MIVLLINLFYLDVSHSNGVFYRGIATHETYVNTTGWCSITIYCQLVFVNDNSPSFVFNEAGNAVGLIPTGYEPIFNDGSRYLMKLFFDFKYFPTADGIQTIIITDLKNSSNYQSVTFYPLCVSGKRTNLNLHLPKTLLVKPSMPRFDVISSSGYSFFTLQQIKEGFQRDPRQAQLQLKCSIPGNDVPIDCKSQLYNPYTGLYKLTFTINSNLSSNSYFNPFNIDLQILINGNSLLSNYLIQPFIQNPSNTLTFSQFKYFPTNHSSPMGQIVFSSFVANNLMQDRGLIGINYYPNSLDQLTPLATNSVPLIGNLDTALFFSKSQFSKSNYFIYHTYINSNGDLNAQLLSNESYIDYDVSYLLDPIKVTISTSSISSSLASTSIVMNSVKDQTFHLGFNGFAYVPPIPTVPFGVSGGLYSNASYSVNYYLSPFVGAKNINSSLYYEQNPSQTKITQFQTNQPGNDILPPIITNFSYIRISSYSYMVQISFKDADSGFYRAVVSSDCILERSDLTMGSLYNGMVEKICYFFSLTPQSISISDLVGNTRSFNVYSAYYFDDVTEWNPPLQIADIPSPINITINEITQFQFLRNQVDTTSGPVNNTLIFNITNANFNLKPRFTLIFDGSDYNQVSLDNTFEGEWDYDQDLYVINFVIPSRLFTSSIQYAILSNYGPITSQHISSKFGVESLLNVTSTNADMMPPLITKIVPAEIQNSIQWLITISDTLNGFASGYINYTSDLYAVPIRIPLTPSPNSGVYLATISISTSSCITQTYQISGISLVDNNGYESSTNNPNKYDPLMLVRDNTNNCVLFKQFQCSTVPERIPPVINSLTVPSSGIDVTSTDRTVQISFSTKDLDSGISSNTPTVYVSAMNGHVFSFPSTETSRSNKIVYYTANLNIPYGFGNGMKSLYLSIYGIMDNHFNLAGYSSSDLAQLTFTATIPIIEPKFYPYIETVSLFHSYGEDLTVTGKNFGGDNFYAIITTNEHSTPLNTTLTSKVESGLLSIFTLPPLNNQFQIQLFNPNPSNIKIIIPYNPAKPNTTCTTSNCIYGTCIFNTCQCFTNYTGSDCSFFNGNSTRPDGNSTNPSTNPSTATTKSLISLYSIRELDDIGTIVEEYFIEKWNFTNSTTVDENNFLYSGNLTTGTIVNVTIQYFLKDKTIYFAGQKIELLAGSTKLSVVMDGYPFKQRTNSLQVLISAQFTNNGSNCNPTNMISGDENLSQIKLILDDKVLYGEFNPTGIIDGRVIKVKNDIISNSTSDNSVGTLIGTTIPYYRNSITLDPNWSILLDPTKGNSQCSSGNGLTNIQKAGIIIASVGLTFVVGASKEATKIEKVGNGQESQLIFFINKSDFQLNK